MSLDKQIQSIQSKIELHDWIDSFPDGARGVILVQFDDPTTGNMSVRYHEIGEITLAETVLLLKSYEYRLMQYLMET